MGRVHLFNFLAQAYLGQVASSALDRFRLGQAKHVYGRFDDVLKSSQVQPEIEVLEDHCQLDSHPAQLAWIRNDQFPSPISLEPNRFIIQDEPAGIWPLQKIDTAKKRAFSRAAGTDNADNVSC